MTIGIVVVARLAATMAGGLTATMMSTPARTSSSARSGSFAKSFCADRTSNRIVRPST